MSITLRELYLYECFALSRVHGMIPLQSWELIPCFSAPCSSRRNPMDNQKVGDNLDTQDNVNPKSIYWSQSDWLTLMKFSHWMNMMLTGLPTAYKIMVMRDHTDSRA